MTSKQEERKCGTCRYFTAENGYGFCGHPKHVLIACGTESYCFLWGNKLPIKEDNKDLNHGNDEVDETMKDYPTGKEEKKCEACGGDGKVKSKGCFGFSFIDCPICNGTGKSEQGVDKYRVYNSYKRLSICCKAMVININHSKDDNPEIWQCTKCNKKCETYQGKLPEVKEGDKNLITKICMSDLCGKNKGGQYGECVLQFPKKECKELWKILEIITEIEQQLKQTILKGKIERIEKQIEGLMKGNLIRVGLETALSILKEEK